MRLISGTSRDDHIRDRRVERSDLRGFLQQIMSELRSEKSSAGSTLKIFFAP